MKFLPNLRITVLLSILLIISLIILFKYRVNESYATKYMEIKNYNKIQDNLKPPKEKIIIPNIEEKKERETVTSTKKPVVKTSAISTKSTIVYPEIKDAATAEKIYYETITKNSIQCANSVRVGRNDDGGWDICILPDYKLKRDACISYSFGVNYIWEFDDIISSKYGCTVRTFDPSMTNEPDQLQRQSKVWFYKIGLGKENGRWSNGWNIMKMSSILKKFKEENKTIDILKVDIEYSEWDSFEMMIKEGLFFNVKQLLFETHTEEVQSRMTSIEGFKRFLKLWRDLYDIGFRQWKNHWNHFGNYQSKRTYVQRTCCFEHYLINTMFLKH